MEQIYGPISAVMLAAMITALVQIIKQKLGADGWAAMVLALIVSLVLAGFYTVISGLLYWEAEGVEPTGAQMALLAFSAIIYSLASWVQSMGWYSFIREARNRIR